MTQPPTLETLIASLREALSAGDIDAALRLGADARTRFPDAPAALFLLCAALLDRRDSRAATILPLIERHPHYAPGWRAIGETLVRQGRAAAALVALDRARAHGTPVERRRAAIARAAALETLTRQGDAADAPLHYRRGVLLRRAGRGEEARAALHQAIDHDPRHAEAHYALGLACQDLGAHNTAAEAYRNALTIRADFHEAALNLGTALQEAGDWEGALDAYAQAVILRPESFGRVAQALAASPRGRLWLDPAALRAALDARL